MDTHEEIARMRHELLNMPTWDREEENCGNCAYWDTVAATRMGLAEGLDLAPCARCGVELDSAGEGGMVLLGPDNHCRNHNKEFAPALHFLLELHDRKRTAA